MFYLILYYTSVVVIPEKYPTEEACKQAGIVWVNKQFICIPAPKYGLADKNCRINSSNAVQCDIN